MTTLQIRSETVALERIETGARARPVNGQAVEALMASIEASGLIQPIQLRSLSAGRLVLIAGAHRLEAHRRLGLAEIRAEIRVCGDDEARLIEVEENLVEAELTTLDLAIHLAEQKRLHEKLHPETRAGHAGAAARWDMQRTRGSAAFAAEIAERRGLSERHIRRLAQAGGNLSPEAIAALRAGPADHGWRTLLDLASEPEPAVQAAAARALVEKRARKVTEALVLARGGVPPVPRAPDERALDALCQAFGRSSAATRRRFAEWLVAEHGDVIEAAAAALSAGDAA